MATTSQITVAATPNISDTALTLVEWLTAGTGIITDVYPGGIARTYAEALGSVNEQEGIIAQTETFQALLYSAYSAFGISPYTATPSIGDVVFSTISGSPIPPGVSITIPNGTIVQASNGTQFATTVNAVLVSGATSTVPISIQSLATGSSTNVASGAITQIVTSLTYPISVFNSTSTGGGDDAENPSATLGRFTSLVDSLGLGSPLAIAAGCIGMSYQGETVKYAGCYEPWLTAFNNGDPPPYAPGFTVIIDNGSGDAVPASSNLITTVYNNLSTGGLAGVGLRPAGVPYSVIAAVPTYANVGVTAVTVLPNTASALQTAITQAVSVYFTSLNFSVPAELTQIIANVANVSFGQLISLGVTLADVNGNPAPNGVITPPTSGRVVLNSVTVLIS